MNHDALDPNIVSGIKAKQTNFIFAKSETLLERSMAVNFHRIRMHSCVMEKKDAPVTLTFPAEMNAMKWKIKTNADHG